MVDARTGLRIAGRTQQSAMSAALGLSYLWKSCYESVMKVIKMRDFFWFALLLTAIAGVSAAQISKPAGASVSAQNGASQNLAPQYSGMYSFLKEGEFVQVTVEDDGRVTGFISRYGDGKENFLDQFFKSGKIDGKKLTFSTKIVGGVSFDFAGSVERGDGKTPAEEGYYVLRGVLTENDTDANTKVTSKSQDVEFRMFPGK